MTVELKAQTLNVLKLIYQPKVFFQQLYLLLKTETLETKRKKRMITIGLPSIVLVAVIAILGLVTVDKLAHIQELKDYYGSLNMSIPEDGVLAKSYYASIFGNAIAQLGMLVVKAALVAGIASYAGGEGKVRESFSIAIYAFIPVLIGKILSAFIFGDIANSFHLGQVIPMVEGSFLYYALQELDIFVIWYQILMIKGIQYTFDVDRKRAIFCVLVPWILFIMIRAGFQNLNAVVGTDIMI